MKKEPTSSRASRRSAGLQSAVNLVLVIIILLFVNYLGFKYYSHRDLSQSQFYNLSPKTDDVLGKLDAPLRISTIAINGDQASYWPQTLALLEEYQRVGGNGGKKVTLDKVDPVYDRARAIELQDKLHFAGTENIVIFQYKDRSRIVKQSDLLDTNPMSGQVGAYKGEQEFTGAILNLEEGKVSKVYFTVGHGEHSIQDDRTATGYGAIGTLVKGENITTADLNLAASGTVPADADAVVIAGPTLAFSPSEVQAIGNYLAANGKLMVLLDPFSPLGLDDILKKYDLGFDNDIVLYRVMTSTGGQSTYPLALIYQTGFAQHPITAKFPAAGYYLQLVNARSIHIAAGDSPSLQAQALLTTGPEAWGWVDTGKLTPEDLMGIKTRTFNPTTDLRGPLVVSALYDGGPVTDPATKAPAIGTRIVLVGCAHFLENDTVTDQQVGVNFFLNALDWVVKKNAVLDIEPKQPQQYGVTLSPMQERTVAWTALFFVPGFCLALGIFTWLSRRK
jgi:ABC-type uncharacterized transport system involved in gliding motility auxiliary subunit